MNLSYFRIEAAKKDAIERLIKWNEKPFKEIIECDYSDAVENSLDENKRWKGASLYCYEKAGWTVFEDLSGGYSDIPGEEWLKYAGSDSLIFAGSNEAIPYGEMIVIEKGILKMEYRDYPDDPDYCINMYQDNDEVYELESWIDVEGYTEEDDYVYSEKGTVLIL